MPLLTTLIDDKSPLISYDALWATGTSVGDTEAIDYYMGTFQTSFTAGATASFSFNGTAIWIYGALRGNHGNYMVTVDSTSSPLINGSVSVDVFQQVLYNTSVTQGMHQMSLVNKGTGVNTWVDIDMIVWQSELGNAGDQLVGETVSDTDSRFQYQGSAWSTSSGSINVNLFNNGTGHITQTPSAAVTFTFQVREAVTLFGTSGPYNGPYSVQLDGGQSSTYTLNTAGVNRTNYGVTIYHADNLGPGSHQIVLTNLPQTNPQALSIDYAQLWTTTSASSASNKISSGAIAGLVVEGVVAILAAAAAIFFYLRWKTERARPHAHHPTLDRTPVMMSSTFAPTQELGSSTAVYSVDRPAARSDRYTDVATSSINNDIEAYPLPLTGHETQQGSSQRPGGGHPKHARRDQTPRDAAVSPVDELPPPDYNHAIEREDS